MEKSRRFFFLAVGCVIVTAIASLSMTLRVIGRGHGLPPALADGLGHHMPPSKTPAWGHWRHRLKGLGVKKLPRLHYYTYCNTFNDDLSFLYTSAGQQGIFPTLVGPGRDDVGLLVGFHHTDKKAKINTYTDVAQDPSKDGSDVIIFSDALDVMVLGNSTEILEKFLILEAEKKRSIFFNSEERCFPDIVCPPNVNYPRPSPDTRWRYLNAGLWVGRVWALRQVLTRHAGFTPYEQEHYQRVFLNASHLIGLDSECLLLCGVDGLSLPSDSPATGARRRGSRVLNVETGATPAVLHFKGVGHWPYMASWGRTTPMHAAFRWLFPVAAPHFYDSRHADVVLRDTRHSIELPDMLADFITWVVQLFERLEGEPHGPGKEAMQIVGPLGEDTNPT